MTFRCNAGFNQQVASACSKCGSTDPRSNCLRQFHDDNDNVLMTTIATDIVESAVDSVFNSD